MSITELTIKAEQTSGTIGSSKIHKNKKKQNFSSETSIFKTKHYFKSSLNKCNNIN